MHSTSEPREGNLTEGEEEKEEEEAKVEMEEEEEVMRLVAQLRAIE